VQKIKTNLITNIKKKKNSEPFYFMECVMYERVVPEVFKKVMVFSDIIILYKSYINFMTV
jgi:hypothetical protein